MILSILKNGAGIAFERGLFGEYSFGCRLQIVDGIDAPVSNPSMIATTSAKFFR